MHIKIHKLIKIFFILTKIYIICLKNAWEQAGLSNATLEVSFELSNNCLVKTKKSHNSEFEEDQLISCCYIQLFGVIFTQLEADQINFRWPTI